MIAADTDALDRLLADDMIWTHSSGVTETKVEFIAAIAERRVTYQRLAIDSDSVRRVGAAVVHQGLLTGTASRDGQDKALRAKFLAVWRDVASMDNTMQLVAWQSTNCS